MVPDSSGDTLRDMADVTICELRNKGIDGLEVVAVPVPRQ